jgi:hypothetical protein
MDEWLTLKSLNGNDFGMARLEHLVVQVVVLVHHAKCIRSTYDRVELAQLIRFHAFQTLAGELVFEHNRTIVHVLLLFENK